MVIHLLTPYWNQPTLFKFTTTLIMKKLNEELNRMKEVMGIQPEPLNEKLTNIDDDVNLIYDEYFREGVDEFEETKRMTRSLFIPGEGDTSMLKDPESVEANAINPCAIYINKMVNHYDPNAKVVSVSANIQAIDFLIEVSDGYLVRAQKHLPYDQANSLAKEFTEERIKGSIHHELAHWIDDTMHNQHIKKFVDRNIEKHNAGEPIPYNKTTVNSIPMERQAQIHNIKQLHNKYKDIWDTLTFNDMMELSNALKATMTSLPDALRKQWVKDTKMRMYREGLLGVKMIN